MLLSKLRWAVVGLLLVLTTGTLGYRFIEGWPWLDCIWMVLITLTTIGYGEPIPLSDHGRYFTMVQIVLGVSLGMYTVGEITRYVVGGRLAEDLFERRRRKQMNKLRDHYIVVGYGRLGREVAAELKHRGHKIVAIDPEGRKLDPHDPILTMSIEGDGSSDGVLEEAHIHEARGLAVATGKDDTNIFVTLTGRQLNPALTILTRINRQTSAAKAVRAGASAVINPYGIGGQRMAQGLLHPTAASLVDRAVGRADTDFELADIEIGETSKFRGKIGALNIPGRFNLLVVAVRKPDGTLQTGSGPETELDAGDVIVVAGRPEDIDRFDVEAGAPPR